MSLITDAANQPLSPGDTVIYCSRHGSSLTLDQRTIFCLDDEAHPGMVRMKLFTSEWDSANKRMVYTDIEKPGPWADPERMVKVTL